MVYKKDAKHMRTSRDGKMNVRKKQLVSSSRRSSTTSVDSSSRRRRRRRRPTRRTPDDSSTEASSRVYSTSYDQSSVSSSSSSSSETSYHRPRKSTSSKKGRDYRREAEHSGRTTRRRGGGGGRRSTSDSGRNQRRRSPETYRSESTRQTYSTYSTVSTRDHDHHGRGNRSFDTADNSESKLQDIGMVVKASDLSDYSDQFTLDSQDMEEFEEFVQKHENRGYGSESDRSSALYSLTRDSSEKASSEPSDDTSGIVEDRSGKMVKKGGLGNCAYKAYFCMPDDESLQGSYGGLRNGEILIAASTLSSHASMMDDGKDFLPRETSVRSDVRQIERIESYASTVEDRATPESVVTKPPSGLSSYFCSWMTGPNSSAENEDEESDPTSNDEDEDEEEDNLQEEDESRQVHQEETDPQDAASVTASERTRTVAVWERPDDATRDSMEVSLDEDRIHAIAQKARSENILTKFKTEMKGQGKPALIIPVSDSVLQEEAKEVQVPIKESSPLVEDTTQVYTDLPYQRILVLGDNVLVSGISEVEAGNGDTGFIIFLRVSRDSLTEDGVAAAERAAATRRSQLVTRAPTIWQSLDDASFEVLVAVVDDEERLVTETPRLLIENNASHYLENLCQLSEASYYCLDASTKKHARKVIELQQQQDQHRTTLDLQTASTLSRDSPRGNSFVSHSSSVETATQFMFCMKAMDLIYTEKSTVDLGTVVESPMEQSRISQISSDHSEDKLEKHNQNKPKTILSTALSSRATVDPSETEKFFVKKDDNATKSTSKFIVKKADGNATKPSTSAAREQNNSKIAVPETPFVAKSSKKVKGNIASSATSGEAIVKTASSVVETPPPPPPQSSSVNESEVDEYINDVARSQESGPEYPKQLREALEFMKATPSRSESDRVTVSEDRPRMSRSTVKAHALLQAGKKPRYERPARPAPKKQGTTTGGMPPQKSDDRGVIQQTKQLSPSAVSPPSSGEESSSDRLCNRSFSHHSSGGEDSLQGTRYMEENTPAGSAESFSNHSGGIHGYLAFLDEEDASGGIRTTSTSKLIVETMRAEPKNLLPIDSTTTTTTTQRTVRNFEISTKSALLISKVEKAAQEAREILARIDFRDDREEEEGSRCSSSDHYHSDNAVLSDDSDNKGDQRRRSRIIPHHPPDARGQVVLRADLLTSIDSPPIPTHVAKLLLTPPAAPDVNSTILEITRVHSNSTIDTKMTSEEKQLQSYEERARLSQHLLLADSSARLAARSTIQSVGVGGGGGGAASTAAEVVEFEKSRIDNWGLSRGRRKTNASVTSSHGSSTSSDEFYDAMSRNSSSNLSENISLD